MAWRAWRAPARQVAACQLGPRLLDRERELARHEPGPVELDAPGGVTVGPDAERVAPPRRTSDDHGVRGLPPSLRPPQLDPLRRPVTHERLGSVHIR